MNRLLLLLCLALPLTAVAADPMVRLHTNRGDIVLQLDTEHAPASVANFLEYVDSGHYNGTIFHRVIAGFMIQGGGFDTDYQQRDTRDPVQNEADNGLRNDRGTVAMARTSDPHSATAQFFINHSNNDFLNHTEKSSRGWGYAVFGKVVEGMDIVDAIAMSKTGRGGPFRKDAPIDMVIIETAERI